MYCFGNIGTSFCDILRTKRQQLAVINNVSQMFHRWTVSCLSVTQSGRYKYTVWTSRSHPFGRSHACIQGLTRYGNTYPRPYISAISNQQSIVHRCPCYPCYAYIQLHLYFILCCLYLCQRKEYTVLLLIRNTYTQSLNLYSCG